MKKRNVSISEFNSNISEYINAVRKGDVIHLTARGMPVAVLISKQNFDVLIGKVVTALTDE